MSSSTPRPPPSTLRTFWISEDKPTACEDKMHTEQARVHYDLVRGIEMLIDLLDSPEVHACSDPLPAHLAEAGVAANYILNGVDLIPDSIPEIGMTDDARILARVLERNPRLREAVR